MCGEVYVLTEAAPCVWHRSYACKCYPNACLAGIMPCYCVACVEARKKHPSKYGDLACC